MIAVAAVPVLGPILHAGGKLLGGVAGAVTSGVMDQVTSWVTDGAKAVTGFVEHAALATTQPDLATAWFGDVFGWIASLAIPIAAVFLVAGVGYAGLTHDGKVLGQTLYGLIRAGWGTGVAVALVVIGVTAASTVASEIAAQIPAQFFHGLSTGWGGSGFGGLAASFLAFAMAIITVFAGVVVWIELLFRMAAIYVGVAVLPLILAASIYPPLSGMLAKAIRGLVVLLIFPIIVEVVLLVGAALMAGGASLSGGIASNATTSAAGAMIFVMAALAPWGTLKLVGLSGEQHGGGAVGAAKRTAGTVAIAAGAAGGAAVILGTQAAGSQAGAGSAGVRAAVAADQANQSPTGD